MRIDVESDYFAIPSDYCCCCGAKADQSKLVSHARTINNIPVETKGWYFPYCIACIEHQKPNTVGHAILVIGGIGCVLSLLNASPVWGLAAGCVTALGFAASRGIAESKMAPECSSVGEAVELLGWAGNTNQFYIRSDRFAKELLRMNPAAAREEPSDG